MKEITDNTFEQEVLKSNIPVLVDFWAEWCGPCKMIAPIISELAILYDSKIKIVKLNVDENSFVTAQYEIMSIPTLILFKDGKIVKKLIGVQSKSTLTKFLDEYI